MGSSLSGRCFALWMLWENLRAPRNWRWLVPYILGLGLHGPDKGKRALCLRRARRVAGRESLAPVGQVTRELLVCTLHWPAAWLGDVSSFSPAVWRPCSQTYQLSVGKNYQLTYAIMTGDGPWHRYLVDLLLVSPIILLLALGAVFRLDRTKKPELFLSSSSARATW